MSDDKTCVVNGVQLSVNEVIEMFKKTINPMKVLRCDLLDGILDQTLCNGNDDYKYAFSKSLNISDNKLSLAYEDKKYLKSLGYVGDFLFSDVIEWIRVHEKFDIWIEHGSFKKDSMTHDVTTILGCHRGSYEKYEEAQLFGIKIFIKYKSQFKTNENS